MTYYRVTTNNHSQRFTCPDKASAYADWLMEIGCNPPRLSVEQG